MIIPLRYVFSVAVFIYRPRDAYPNTILHKQISLRASSCSAAYKRSSYIAALLNTHQELIYNIETEQNTTNRTACAAHTTNDLIASEGDNNNNNSVSRVLGAVWCKAISEIYIVGDSSFAAGII